MCAFLFALRRSNTVEDFLIDSPKDLLGGWAAEMPHTLTVSRSRLYKRHELPITELKRILGGGCPFAVALRLEAQKQVLATT